MERFLLNDGKALAIIEAATLAEAQRFVRERGHTGELGDAAAVQRALEAAQREQAKDWARLGVTEAVALHDRWGAAISPLPIVRVCAQPGAGSSSPAPVTASEAELRAQIRAAVDAALREAGLAAIATQAVRPQAPVTERRSSTPDAAQSQMTRKLVELREGDAQPMSESEKAEAVRGWMVLGLSEAAAKAAVEGA